MILGQLQNGKEVVVAYAGRGFNQAERNYSVTEREALSVVEGIRYFQSYLYGRKLIVHTDHNALKWLMQIRDPTGRLARWSLLLQQMLSLNGFTTPSSLPLTNQVFRLMVNISCSDGIPP